MVEITPDINTSSFYMVWKSYCGRFSACLTQLLVTDDGLK